LSRSENENAERISREVIEEARMVLPGIQALFGFQLIGIFSDGFRQLSAGEQIVHFAALVLVALSIAVIMTPAAYHRLAEPNTVTPFFVRLASWLIAAAMVPLMLALSLEVYLLGRLVLADAWSAAAIAVALFAVFAALWFVFPLAMRNPDRRLAGYGCAPTPHVKNNRAWGTDAN